MNTDRAWVLLKSGRRINLLDPQPDAWDDSDLAVGLSRTYRWGGHSAWDLPLSVAQHSLTVLALRERMSPPLGVAARLRELLHDAGDEGFLSFDCIAPLKPHLGPGYAAVAARLQDVVALRYRLPAWNDADYALHKQADRMAAASEARHVVGWSIDDIRAHLRITTEPVADDPLPIPAGLRAWEPWAPNLAAALFLQKLQALLAERDAGQ